MYKVLLGIRSLIYRKKQYMSLFLISLFGVGISLFSLFLSKGMINSLNEKAEIYYGGDFCIMSSEKDEERRIYDYENMTAKVKELLPSDAVVTLRYDCNATEKSISFYYEGTELRQRMLKGVNFNDEKYLFSKLNYIDGDSNIEKGSNRILISEPIAKRLRANCGDSITLYIKTIDGFYNTVDLVVQGIFRDSSVFGMYTTYIDFDFLRKCYGRGTDFANRICVEFPERNGLTQNELEYFQSLFEQNFVMYQLTDDKNDFYKADFTQITYAMIPLKGNLSDVKILKNAMTIVVKLIIIMLVVIIVAGIGSTYRVIVMKRINEIGIYMAIGMRKKDIMATLLFENLFLLIAGCIGGFVFSGILCRITTLLNLDFIPSFSIFLTNGRLLPMIDFTGMITVVFSVIFVTLAAVFYSVYKAVSIVPSEAIASNE